MAAMVSEFGQFIKADEITKAMTDIQAFRYKITLDSITDIPQNLSIVLGDEEFAVMVHLESWEREVLLGPTTHLLRTKKTPTAGTTSVRK